MEYTNSQKVVPNQVLVDIVNRVLNKGYDDLSDVKMVGGKFITKDEWKSIIYTMLYLSNVSPLLQTITLADGSSYQLGEYEIDWHLDNLFDLHRGYYKDSSELVRSRNLKSKFIIPKDAVILNPSQLQVLQAKFVGKYKNQFKKSESSMESLLAPVNVDLSQLNLVTDAGMVFGDNIATAKTLPIYAPVLNQFFTEDAFNVRINALIDAKIADLIISLQGSNPRKDNKL